MIYYVDSKYGCDSNDGLSRQTAFASLDRVNQLTLCGGDAVLFKADCEFTGTLEPQRERDGGVIKISCYGTGDNPCIIANGSAAIRLCNFDNVEMSYLNIRNPDGRYGILVENTVGGAMKHIHIQNCTVSDINKQRLCFKYESGGIICTSFCDEPGWFEDLLLEDNNILDVCRTGILLTGFWANRPKLWGKNEYKSDLENWWPSKKVVVRGNYIDRTGGDGIVLIGTQSALIEWNTVYRIMTNPPINCANAGIWPQASNDCIVQYNEVGYCNKPDGCNDAQGIDVDLSCRDTVIQYNYTHDNAGGFLLLCELNATTDEDNFRGTVVRNNLSVNDGNVKGELIALVGPVRGAVIENNTFYATGNVERIVEVFSDKGVYAKDVVLRRNLIIANGRDNQFHIDGAENITFYDNLFWGAHRDVPKGHKNTVVKDPRLCLSGAVGEGRGVIANYIPKNESLILGEADMGQSAPDLLGRDTQGKMYIGALLPQCDEHFK